MGRSVPPPQSRDRDGSLLDVACTSAGFTLAESLIAAALLFLGLIVALSVYDAARKSLQRSENLTEQQQAARTALDEITSHVRAAGFGVNPDGNLLRGDEAIEAAYDTAIVVRGDFDAEDPVAATAPEEALAGGAFRFVSTGNDEIVAFVLAKGDGTDTEALRFDADVADSPRDGAGESITVADVSLVPAGPPYTLYRVTLNNDPSKWGSGSFAVRTPIMDNVLSLTFRYFDAVGTLLNPGFDLWTTPDDIAGDDTASARALRSRIRTVSIELVGLTRDPEIGWSDPADPNPLTRSHRKFRLATSVTPRSAAQVGAPDLLVRRRMRGTAAGHDGA